jgi:hypothetical protein
MKDCRQFFVRSNIFGTPETAESLQFKGELKENVLHDAKLVLEAAIVPLDELIEPQLSSEHGCVHGNRVWEIEV